MHIILTHEQADFDALASLLGAHLVDETSVPVLPRRMNRNVRAFITLYGVELPFIDPRDLPNRPVGQVTLVDTQSMISVKGMGPKTKVQVIDHHPAREGLPPNWEITTDDTGATATLFVEVLRERDNLLSTVAATLLLLGIYEDTGSLTYTRTSARDLSAAAFLLERGASLEIATDFLNHPLSPGQQALYNRMRANARSHNVHGHIVILACGDAQEVDEELSTVAHKMRDLLDPDALFLLANTRGGVQLIARSTSDHIDVAQITEHFGGGGHERAAASLIKDRELESVCQELLTILPRYIHPAITVAQFMSGGPQLLSPETPVEEAAQRMLRYGYEGYPVVQEGKVVGLLNRRAVDRALAHKLKLTAASLMEAGEVSVRPEDSIEHLQRVMTETGWGQVPVVHAETGQIVGIVTRTDLLKTLASAQRIPGRQNLADRLENALPAARLSLLKAIARAAHDRHSALFIVGGFVRDLLLDRPSQDFDLVVEGDAIELARGLAGVYGGRVTSHSRFGTAKWHIAGIRPDLVETLKKVSETQFANGKSQRATFNFNITDLPEFVDLITARTEFYTHPTALPTVERGSIKLDLHRRDFTINTLALRLDGYHYGELHDYWGGLNDLRSGFVRALHSLSFIDDPTRMLRAVRFEQRFAFQIEERTLELIQEARSLLERVSGDRIRHELDHILQEDRACLILARLHDLDLLTAIHPDLVWDDWLAVHIQNLTQAKPGPEWDLKDENGTWLKPSLTYILWLIRLPTARAHSLISRLKLSRTLGEVGLAARRLWRDMPSLAEVTPSQVVTRLESLPPLALYANYLACADPFLKQVLLDYVTRWRNVSPTIDGNILRARGLPPGPRYRQILATLRAAWLDGKIETVEQETALLEEIIKTQGIRD